MSARVEIVAAFDEAGQRVIVRRRGDAYDVVLGNVVLLASDALATEHGFGRLAAELAPGGAAPRAVVVGGLGFAATLRGVLEVAAPDARVWVVEKLAAVEAIARGPLAHLTGGALDDPRVSVIRADVGDLFLGGGHAAPWAQSALDVVLLDVDNGPEWASFRGNARLYAQGSLVAMREHLAPGGALAIWSGYAADGFLARLRAAELTPRTVLLHERGVVRARAYVGVRAPEGPSRA